MAGNLHLIAYILLATTFFIGLSNAKVKSSRHQLFYDLEDLEDAIARDIGSGEPDEDDNPPDSDQDTDMFHCTPASRRNTNKYVDRVLEEVRPKLPEPADLPNRNGRFRLFNGTLSNLSSIKRSGPAMVRCSDNSFSFMVPITLKNLTGRYSWEADIGRANPLYRGHLDLYIKRVDADVLYTREYLDESGEPLPSPKAKVEKLSIKSLDGAEVNFEGLGPLNWFVSRLTNFAIRVFNKGVARVLEGPVRKAINKELENVEKYEFYYF